MCFVAFGHLYPQFAAHEFAVPAWSHKIYLHTIMIWMHVKWTCSDSGLEDILFSSWTDPRQGLGGDSVFFCSAVFATMTNNSCFCKSLQMAGETEGMILFPGSGSRVNDALSYTRNLYLLSDLVSKLRTTASLKVFPPRLEGGDLQLNGLQTLSDRTGLWHERKVLNERDGMMKVYQESGWFFASVNSVHLEMWNNH